MATAGVSRSGRVRKKSAKLIEMETEGIPNLNHNNNISITTNNTNDILKTPKVSPNINQNNVSVEPNQTSVDDIVVNNHSDLTQPLKKKLKIKLSLSPSPVVSSDVQKASTKLIENNIKEEITPKKELIPPLKILKSKITGLVPNITPITPETNSSENIIINETNQMTTHSTSVEKKSKKVKNQLNEKTVLIESKPEPKEVIETMNELPVNETIVESVDQNKVNDKVNEKVNDKPIVETPKLTKDLKPKKKEPESAANRLFRQITSGVAANTKGKGNKRNKSLPLEDVTQITFDEEFSETSLIIETEDLPKPKPKNRRSRPTKTSNDNKRSKRGKNMSEGPPKKKRNAVITAYMIWSKEHRSKIQQSCPDLDFADVSRKLGEIWQSMPEKDKIPWRRKAQKLVTKGSSIISTGKPKATPQTSKLDQSLAGCGPSGLANSDDSFTSIEDLWQPVGTSPIDVSAHLTLLGESLSIIGQRLKEHSGQIAVSGSLSVLLDSTLCAIGPLLCLTQLHPKLDGCPEDTHKKTLDNITYIMPGI